MGLQIAMRLYKGTMNNRQWINGLVELFGYLAVMIQEHFLVNNIEILITYRCQESHDEEYKSEPDFNLGERRVVTLELKKAKTIYLYICCNQ